MATMNATIKLRKGDTVTYADQMVDSPDSAHITVACGSEDNDWSWLTVFGTVQQLEELVNSLSGCIAEVKAVLATTAQPVEVA